MELTPRAVGWGLLFAIPPGLAAGGFVARIERGSLETGVAFGVGLAAVIFLLVVAAAGTGEPNRESETP